MRKSYVWRWIFFIVGLFVLGLGFAMTVKAKVLGVGPWEVLSDGLSLQIGGTIAFWTSGVGFIIMVITALVLKEWPKIGTWLNMILIGVFLGMFVRILPDPSPGISTWLMFFGGVIVISIGVGMYVSPRLGAGPRDYLMIVLNEKFGWSIRASRTLVEVLAAVTGWLLGGVAGVGTIIVALGVGPLVQWTLPFFTQLLERLKYE